MRLCLSRLVFADLKYCDFVISPMNEFSQLEEWNFNTQIQFCVTDTNVVVSYSNTRLMELYTYCVIVYYGYTTIYADCDTKVTNVLLFNKFTSE